MKFQLALAAVAALFLAACEPQVDYAEAVETDSRTGSVQSIDQENRRFQVLSEGQLITFKADGRVANFDELEVGDRITIEYVEGVALGMADPSDTGETMGAGIAGTAPLGAKPGAAGAEVLSGVVQFLSYDTRSHVATTRLAGGEIALFAVRPEFRSFARSRKPGDRVAVVYERAVAVSVTPEA